MRWIVMALLAVSAGCARAQGTDWVWWEAENPKATNFPPAQRNPFAPLNAKEAEALSSGAWIGITGDRPEPAFLEYEVAVPKSGEYRFFARKFWQHGPYRWRFDSQPWQQVGHDVALLDEAPLRQFIGANWTPAGPVTLTAGPHTLRIELTEKSGGASFDCFLLTMRPFTARGKLKPGEKYNRAPAGWFAFEPDPDPFKPTPLDLRSLNEPQAGAGGFIQVKGGHFVYGATGEPVRFWAVNTGSGTVNLDRASIDLMARSLAKQGVNLIRIHGPVFAGDIHKVDPTHLDRLQYFVGAMKKQGIYTCLSIYFPLWLKPDGSEFAGYSGQNAFSLLYFNAKLQEIYRNWWRGVLTAENPHTGLPLGKDPAVAILEMVNEDSNLFWTFSPQNIPAPEMELLQKQFGAWLAAKYGTLDKAYAAWGPGQTPPSGGERAPFRPMWELFNTRDRRSQDTVLFLTLNQREFYQKTYAFLKQEMGFKGSVYASNWITADARVLGPLDKWSNTVADFMDRHGYFGGRHEGPRAGYSISVGDKYEDRSALLFSPEKPGGAPDFNLPIWDIQYDGKPSTITEINWTPPNRFRADLPLVAAAYGDLQGTDALYFFATGSPSWEETLGKFGIRTPVIAGQFPAAALIFRRALVKESAPVVDVSLKLADLFALQGAPVTAPANLDELRARDIPPGKSAPVEKVAAIDPLAFAAGKVAIRFSEAGGPSAVADLSRLIDRERKRVRSASGELSWDYGRGVVTINAPQAQAVTGFLGKAGAIQLSDITIETPLEYGAVALVSLDGKPLRQSGRMLLQVMSEEQPYGWEAPGDGFREIKSIGTPPMVVRDLAGTVTLARADAASLRITPLDANGYPAGAPSSGGRLTLKPATLYYLVEKQ